MYAAARQQMTRLVFSLLAAVFSNSVFADYVANQIDYIDPTTRTVANFTQLWGNNKHGNALGFASFDSGVTGFSFAYDPATGNYLRLPQPPGFDGITSFAQAVGINDAGVMTGSTFEPTGVRSFTLKEGVYTFFSAPGWAETFARTIGNPTVAHPEGLVVGYVDDGVFETSDSTNGFVYDPVTSASPRSIRPRSLRLHTGRTFSAKSSAVSSLTVPRSHLAVGASSSVQQPARIRY